ncbi:MAG: hypothetical protein Pars2KO_33450 [Parasphingorhabdus sp.]
MEHHFEGTSSINARRKHVEVVFLGQLRMDLDMAQVRIRNGGVSGNSKGGASWNRQRGESGKEPHRRRDGGCLIAVNDRRMGAR